MANKPIHIVHIIPALPFGGAERFLVDLINNSDPAKFKFSIITTREENPLQVEIKFPNVKVEIVPKRGKISWHLFKDIENKLKILQPDIVHTHLFTGDFWGRVAAKRLQIPVITTEHNINQTESWLHGLVKKCLKNYSEFYTCPSQAVKNYLESYYKITKPISLIRHGIELTKFSSIPKIELNKTIKFLILGRITKQKGHAVALQALAGLKDYDWQLEIVGSGELETEIKNKILELNLESRVKMLPATSEVVEVMKSHQILLVPSLWEGLGIVAMEAMASGRLVIASQVDGLPELIDNNKTGLLFTPGNVQALQAKLVWCFNNLSEVNNLAQAGRDYALTNFSVVEMTKKYE